MKRLLLYSGLVVLILILQACSIRLFLVMSTGARVARQRDAITASGDSLYLTDYARDPIPDEDNACHFLMLANADLKAFDEQFGRLSKFEHDLERRLRPEEVDELEQLVEQFSQRSQAYKMIERAAACSQYDARVDYSQGISAELPHATLFRFAARAFQARSLVRAYRGDGNGALGDCEQSIRLSAHLRGEPLLIVHLVSISCQTNVAQSANHVLRVATTSSDARKQLDAALAAIDNRRDSIAAMKGERAMGTLTFEQLRSGKLDPAALDAPSSPLSFVSRTWLGQAYLNDDEAKYLELMDLHIQAAQQNAKDREAVIAPIDQELQAGGMRHMLTRLLVPALDSTMAASDRGDTLNHCLRVLLALEGRDHAALGDLGLPDAATRDASGLPLVIRHTEQGWIVYSVGEDGIDDGGRIDWSELIDFGLAPLGEAPPIEDAEDDAP